MFVRLHKHGINRAPKRSRHQRAAPEATDQIGSAAGQPKKTGKRRADGGHFDRLIQMCITDIEQRGLYAQVSVSANDGRVRRPATEPSGEFQASFVRGYSLALELA